MVSMGMQWLSGRVLDSRPKGRGFEPHRRHCVVSLSKNINPSLVLVQPRKTRPFITERLLMGRKESNQTNKQTKIVSIYNLENAGRKLKPYLICFSFVEAITFSTIDSGEKGYKLPEQILFNSLALFPTLSS